MADSPNPFATTLPWVPSVPIGTIIAWNKPLAVIPRAWSLCDGSNGTPDLRNRFIVGAGSTYDPGDIGGNAGHGHDFESDGHDHAEAAGTGVAGVFILAGDITTETLAGETEESSHLPPYYSLPYIIYTGYH